jgi:hypothetical protein
MQVKELSASNLFIYLMLRASSEGQDFVTEEFMDKLVLGVATLALSAGAASAQAVYPGYGYAPYGYGYAPYGYGYGYAATAPLYDYAAPAYGYGAVAPATGGSTVIIVMPAPAYTAAPVGSGYYNYAPGYWGGYGHWRAGW